jgi:hypothetical protein
MRIRYQSISYRQEKPHKEKVLLDYILVVDKKYNFYKYWLSSLFFISFTYFFGTR